MPVIVVVEQDLESIARAKSALETSGWQVTAVDTVQEALELTATEPPLLFVISVAIEGAGDMLEPFSRRRGGPGTLALVSAGDQHPGVGLQADQVVAKPFSAMELRAAVERALELGGGRPSAPSSDVPKLTSKDIFGDLVADLEGAVQSVTPAPGEPTPRNTAPRPANAGSAMDRRLEETLTGLFNVGSRPTTKPGSAQTPSSAPPTSSGLSERRLGSGGVDDLLSKTLSDLDVGLRRRPVAPVAPPAAAPPAPAVPPPAPVVPAASAPTRRTGEFKLEDLERWARPDRRETTGVTGTGTAAPAPKPLAPVPMAPPPAPAFASLDLSPPPELPAPPPPVAPEPPPEPVADGSAFGQYRLLERIGLGGMAEVWKARMLGVEGFQKTVAIKRILAHLTSSSDFVEMFVDEAKLAAQLNHDNIIHIYDLGKIGDDFYIAMEYVEGENLRAILNAARARGEALPQGLALYIAARLAHALGYAHRKRDFEGHELGLVHRDVSPQNVLISYGGSLKLCDFGIVKAVSKNAHTQLGALKGKLQYMSPEQAWGRPVDARSDIFAVGVLLFEMLTGERLFTGETEMELLEAVREARVRAPSELVPEISTALDAVIGKALARDSSARYQSADELAQALEGLLARFRPVSPGPSELAAYMEALFRGGPWSMAATYAEPRPQVRVESVLPPRVEEPFAAPTQPLVVPEEVLIPVAEPPRTVAPSITNETVPVPMIREPPPARAPLARAASVDKGSPADKLVPAVPSAHDHPASGHGLEENRKGRGLLIAAILLILAAGAAAAWYFQRGKLGANPAPAPEGEQTVPQPGEGQALPPGAGTMPAEGTLAPTETAPIDPNVVQAVDAELARREAELRRQFDEEQRKIEEKLKAAQDKNKVAAPPAVTPSPETAAPAPVPTPVVAEPEPSPPPVVVAPPPQPPPTEPSPTITEPPPPAPPSVKVGDLVTMGPGVTPPQLVTFTKPQYPPLARKLRVSGEVLVGLLVDESGAVLQTRLQKGAGQNVGLNEAALEAARTAKYRPATKDGVRVKMWTTLKIPFQL